MASSNDHMPVPPPTSKPRLSPLDFRNTELVSRLLAATPPYLYNMSLLPNSYFFSEMLRSLVQAKQENTANAEGMMASSLHNRRSRKRPWMIPKHEEPKHMPKVEKLDSHDWTRNTSEKNSPIELIRKSPNVRMMEDSKSYLKEKSASFEHVQTDNPNNSGLVLPPAPPIWFPPIYPSPYVDPLHFFIDLKVSGHIYDKSQKDSTTYERTTNKEYPSTVVSTNTENEQSQQERSHIPLLNHRYGSHNSAFSVPNHKHRNSSPMNLTQVDGDTKCTKFDVKSMGFEKSTNKTGTKYVVSNIESIYRKMNPSDECTPEKRTKLEEEKTNSAFRLFSDTSSSDFHENSPVDVVDGEDPGFRIDVQT